MLPFRSGADSSDDDCHRFAGRVSRGQIRRSLRGVGAAVYEPRLFSGAAAAGQRCAGRRGWREGLHPTRASRSKAWIRSHRVAWLHRTTVHVSIDVWRSETRRRVREEKAIAMELAPSEPETLWNGLAPQLDEALNRLTGGDHQAWLLRYFDGKRMRDLGRLLGVSEDAAKMRVNRARIDCAANSLHGASHVPRSPGAGCFPVDLLRLHRPRCWSGRLPPGIPRRNQPSE